MPRLHAPARTLAAALAIVALALDELIHANRQRVAVRPSAP